MSGGEGSSDKTILNRTMLRFRPIAPKPAAGGQPSSEHAGKNAFVGVGRKKRRYKVRVSSSSKKRGGGGSKCVGSDNNDNYPDGLKTLRLLPEESVHDPGKGREVQEPSDLSTEDEIRRPRASRVTVLGVTDACMGGEAWGHTDQERWRALEADTCPGFVSDSCSRVVWCNAAFRDTVGGGGGGVALALADDRIRLPVTCQAFSCMVRMEYTWQKGTKTAVVPSDVFRMSDGGYAWRLDPKAGLSLGLGL